jgi:hypothetical protein
MVHTIRKDKDKEMKTTNHANIIRTIRKEINRHKEDVLRFTDAGAYENAIISIYKKIALEELLETIKQN